MDEDEALARALAAAEQGHYDNDAYGVYDDDGAPPNSDSDWDGGEGRKRRRQRPRARKRPPLPPPPPGDVAAAAAKEEQHPPQNTEASAITTTGRRVRRDKDARREAPARAWTDDEEALFESGLARHGRDWARVAEVVRTRDGRAVASHAQKHFVRLCARGAALPAKVAESGPGYTLSGRLLDPRSASARAYGFRIAALRRLEGEALATALRGIAVEHLAEATETAAAMASLATGSISGSSDAAFEAAVAFAQREQAAAGASVAQPRRRATEGAAAPSDPDQPQQPHQAPPDAPPPPASRKRKTPSSLPTPPPPAPPAPSPPSEPTEYARNRPRRDGAGQHPRLGGRHGAVGATTEALDLMPCLDFLGPPGSGAPLAQPFSVDVSPHALLIADFHAHLSSCEVIGLLGGTWCPRRRALCVRSAVPCRRAAGSEASTSVELCPGSEVEARAELQRRGQAAVGWYHSHPVFEPTPSLKDCENQRNYQALFRAQGAVVVGGGGGGGGGGGEGNGNNANANANASNAPVFEPFVGFILSPYDPALAAPRSAVGAFVVRRAPPGKGAMRGGLAPYSVRYSVGAETCGGGGGPEEKHDEDDDGVERRLLALAHELRDDVGRTDLAGMWRPFTLLRGGPGGPAEGPPMTRARKLQLALAQRSGPALAARVLRALQRSWGVDLGLGLRASEEGGEEEGTTDGAGGAAAEAAVGVAAA